MEKSNRQVISVSDLNRDAKRLLESEFPILYVEGEISNLAQPGSGHWYFTLKDDRAQIRCAMFKNRNHMVRFKPRNGQKIIVRGRISLYEGRGEFQMIAEFLEDSGDGGLRRAFEKLKAALQAEGLFDQAGKKPDPNTAGAYSDHNLAHRGRDPRCDLSHAAPFPGCQDQHSPGPGTGRGIGTANCRGAAKG